MSGICSHCSECKEFYGRFNIAIGVMIYDCADECPYYQAERKAAIEAKRAKEAEEKAKAEAEAEAKKKAELEELYRYFEENAKEPSWFPREFPRHHAAGWRLREVDNIFGWTKGKETVIAKGFIPPLPNLA